MDAFRDLKPVQGMQMRSNMVVFGNPADCSSKAVLDMLQSGYLIGRKVKV